MAEGKRAKMVKKNGRRVRDKNRRVRASFVRQGAGICQRRRADVAFVLRQTSVKKLQASMLGEEISTRL